eukprot:g5355.t1
MQTRGIDGPTACVPAGNDIGISANELGKQKRAIKNGAKYCTVVSSAEPTVWGPIAWSMLHTMAAHYPKSNPNEAHISGCVNFITGLPYMLPCGECGFHLLKELENYPTSLRRACSSRYNLAQFFVDAHNDVSRHLEKPLWTTEKALEHYGTSDICIYNDKSWDSETSL